MRFVEPINQAFDDYGIAAGDEQAMFLAQYAHETEGFARLEENLRYTTVDALLAATRPRWDPLDRDDAWGYLNQPERLANRIYAGRHGNGDEASGDGYRFRGRGLPHLTFRGNYQRFADASGIDAVANPDLVAQPDVGTIAGAWFWKAERCGELASRGDFEALTQRINGGMNGFAYRTAYLVRARQAIA